MMYINYHQFFELALTINIKYPYFVDLVVDSIEHLKEPLHLF
jgi:hypothetical protein